MVYHLTTRGRTALRLILIVLVGLLVGLAMHLGEPALPRCPVGHAAAERCQP